MTSPDAGSRLAIDGRAKTRSEPWPERGLFDGKEKDAVDSLFDRAIATGEVFDYDSEEETAYCREFAEFHGGGYTDSVSSGTAALYVALRALESEPFTEVIVPAVTDPGGVMPIPLTNCIPVVADSAPGTLHVKPDYVEQRILLVDQVVGMDLAEDALALVVVLEDWHFVSSRSAVCHKLTAHAMGRTLVVRNSLNWSSP